MGGIFSGPKAPPPAPTPTPTPPAPMPDSTSPAVLQAKNAAAQEAMARAGRSSTILTTKESRSNAGADTYASRVLGS